MQGANYLWTENVSFFIFKADKYRLVSLHLPSFFTIHWLSFLAGQNRRPLADSRPPSKPLKKNGKTPFPERLKTPFMHGIVRERARAKRFAHFMDYHQRCVCMGVWKTRP